MKEEDVLLTDEELFSIASDEFLVMRGEHNGYSMAIDLIVAQARKLLRLLEREGIEGAALETKYYKVEGMGWTLIEIHNPNRIELTIPADKWQALKEILKEG